MKFRIKGQSQLGTRNQELKPEAIPDSKLPVIDLSRFRNKEYKVDAWVYLTLKRTINNFQDFLNIIETLIIYISMYII